MYVRSFLILKPQIFAGPLAQFQAARFEHDDFLRLIRVVNERLGERKLREKNLNTIFEKFWPDLQSDINRLLESGADDNSDTSPRDDREILEKILQLVRKPQTRSGVSDVAIHELLKHYIALHDEQAGRVGDYQSALKTLKKMHGPLSFILRQSPRLTKTAEVRRFSGLSYEVEEPPTSSSDEFDDDIPF